MSPAALNVAHWPGPTAGLGNPFVRLLANGLEQRGASVVDFTLDGAPSSPPLDIVHVHWPEWVLDAPLGPKQVRRTARLLTALARARRRGARLVWTVHNVGAHDPAGRRQPMAWSLFVRHVDGFISLTEAGLEAARARLPGLADVPAFVIPHGHYRDAYPNTVSPAEARSALGIPGEAKVALFLGQVRPYKNVTELIAVHRGVAEPDSVLLVAGRPSSAVLRDEITAAASGDDRVRLNLEFVPVEEVQRFLNAADVVVLPYRETLNSGAALLALSFDRPVLVPAAGAFVELARRRGEQWVRSYEGPLSATTLTSALRAPAPEGRAPLDDLSWDCIAAQTLTAYTNLRQ